MRTERRFAAAVLLLALFLMTGCSETKVNPNRGAVEGIVSFQSTPLKGGSVTIINKDNPELRVTCFIREDGTFSIDNAPKGTNLLAVETYSTIEGYGDRSHFVEIPKKYNRIETSGLTCEIPSPEGKPVEIVLR